LALDSSVEAANAWVRSAFDLSLDDLLTRGARPSFGWALLEATMAKKKAVKKQTGRGTAAKGARGRKKAVKRELIDTGNDKRYVRRNEQGQFDEVDDVGRSLAQDRRRHAKTVSKPGQGDKGDRLADWRGLIWRADVQGSASSADRRRCRASNLLHCKLLRCF
jgi:hypothetical protein